MAALSQDDWYTKISKFVPSWYFEKESEPLPNTPAVFRAMAAVFSQIQHDTDDGVNATFLTLSSDPVLDLMGDERSIARIPGELDPPYSNRVQRITSQTDEPDIQAAVDHLLLVMGCLIRESPDDHPYASRKNFASRDWYVTAYRQDFFTLVTPLQAHAPYAFSGSGSESWHYFSDWDYAGPNPLASVIYQSVIALVNSMKAFGVMYRLAESRRSVLN
jgi:hypothetical protein